MSAEELDDLVGETASKIAEVYEPDVWSNKTRLETFWERMLAVEGELRAFFEATRKAD